MGLFDILGITSERHDERLELVAHNTQLQEELSILGVEVREVREDLLRISDAFDRAGTTAIGMPENEAVEIPLATVKKVAKLSRAMNAMNPFVKRGVEARMGYIWGKGVAFDGVAGIKEQVDLNKKKLFSAQAYEELERVLATDGNAFTALSINDADPKATAFRISIDQISGAVSNPLDKEEIWYYKREYSTTVTNSVTGIIEEKPFVKYYASAGYYSRIKEDNKNLPKRWGKVGIEQNYVIQHTAVNKQVGWRWGVPDIMPVIFWAMAYKEYLEDNAMLVKAYSRLAWQVKPTSAAGAQAAAAQVMAPPTRDPMTGETRHVGGTAINGLGGELSPVAATGSSVDFSKGSPLASAIAAGLEVSLVVITSDPGDGSRATAETLDLPTLKAMEKRQQLHTERFLEIFQFWGADVGDYTAREVQEAAAESKKLVSVTWPQIESDATKDRIAALGVAVELGILYKQEARKEALEAFGIAPFKPWDKLPMLEDDPAAKEKAASDAAQAEASVVPGQGKDGGIAAKGGALATANQSRANRNKDSNNS